MEDHTDLIEALIVRIENYGKTTLELGKLQLADGTASALSSLIARTAVILTIAMFLLVLNIGIALWLGELLGKVYYGFFAIAAFYLVMGVFFHLVLHGWIRKPIATIINTQAFNLPEWPDEQGIKDAIALQEEKREQEAKILRQHLHSTLDSLKPVNLVKNTVNSIMSSREIKEDMVTTATGLAAGFVAKKIVSGASKNEARNIAGTMVETGIINLVARHQKEIKVGWRILSALLGGKKPADKNK